MTIEALSAMVEALETRLAEAKEQRDDAVATLDAWFDRRKLSAEAVDQAVLDAVSAYLRVCSCGGMPTKDVATVKGVVADMARQSLFADLFSRALDTQLGISPGSSMDSGSRAAVEAPDAIENLPNCARCEGTGTEFNAMGRTEACSDCGGDGKDLFSQMTYWQSRAERAEAALAPRSGKADERYPAVFFSADREQRVKVGHYRTADGLDRDVCVETLIENKPGGRWLQVRLLPDEAEQMALHLLKKVDSARAANTEEGAQ